MKSNKIKIIFLMGFLFFNCFYISLKAIDYPLEIDAIKIRFNYDLNSYSHDALSITTGYSNPIIVIEDEWDIDEGHDYPIAYIKGQTSRRIKVTFRHNQDQSRSYTFLMAGYVDQGTSFGDAWSTSVYFPSNNNGISNEITYQLHGSVPNSVGKRYARFMWECIDYGAEYFWTEHDYYTLLAAPQAPMAIPWTTVLDNACVWASGQTSSENAANDITNCLFTCGFDYDTGSGAPRYGGWSTFNLTQFLSELGSSYDVNCLDMGKAVTTFGNAIGCGLYLTTFSGGLSLNCIDPIGAALPTNNPFSSPLIGNDCRYGGFSYHAFSQNSSKNTWDACLKYDIDGDPDNVTGSNPGCGSTTTGYSWILPSNEQESTYIQRLLDYWTTWENCSNPYNCGYFTYQRAFSVN
ncbi:MAG: hypothetical protein PVH88_09445 [Ignavibacteria bacterium]|jgi:hypothetical protein